MTFPLTQSLIFFSFLSVLSSCKSGESNTVTITPSGDNPAAKVNETDFMVSAPDIDADAFTEALNDDSFYTNIFKEYAYESDNDVVTTCIDEMFKEYPFKSVGDDYYLIDTPMIDASSCFGSIFENTDSVTYEFNYEASSYFKVKIIDHFGTPVNLEGMLDSDLDTYSKAPYKVSVQQKFLGAFGSIATFTDGGSVYDESSDFKYMLSSQDSADGACTIDFNEGRISDCSMYSWDASTSSSSYDPENSVSEEKIIVSVAELHDLQGSETGEFFSVGSIDFTLNNWSGAFTFGDRDENTPPSYTATNGVEQITGQIKPLYIPLDALTPKALPAFKSMGRP